MVNGTHPSDGTSVSEPAPQSERTLKGWLVSNTVQSFRIHKASVLRGFHAYYEDVVVTHVVVAILGRTQTETSQLSPFPITQLVK